MLKFNWDRSAQSDLWRHLKRTDSAILDFITHPDARLQQGDGNRERVGGTLCFAIWAPASAFLRRVHFIFEFLMRGFALWSTVGSIGRFVRRSVLRIQERLVSWSVTSDGPVPSTVTNFEPNSFPRKCSKQSGRASAVHLPAPSSLSDSDSRAPARFAESSVRNLMSHAMKTVHVVISFVVGPTTTGLLDSG